MLRLETTHSNNAIGKNSYVNLNEEESIIQGTD